MKHFILNKKIPSVLRRNGIDAGEVLQASGLPRNLFSHKTPRVSPEEYVKFVDAIGENFSSETDIVSLATKTDFERISPPIFAALCCHDAISAINRMKEYSELFIPMSINTLLKDGRFEYSFGTLIPGSRISPFFAMVEMIFFLNIIRTSTGSHIVPMAVETGAEMPSGAVDFFGITPKNTGRYAVILSESDARKPFVSENQEIWKKIEPELNRRLAEQKADSSVAEKAKAAIYELLPSGRFKIEDIAHKLSMTPRTLQRRLLDENSRYQELLLSARKSLNADLDRMPLITHHDRAYLLGFSHNDCYRRALG